MTLFFLPSPCSLRGSLQALRSAQNPAQNVMLKTVHNAARWEAQKRACSVLVSRRENGRVAGSQQARSRLVACNTAAPAGLAWCAPAARQTFRLVQPEGSGTRPFSGCPEGSACGALGVVPRSPLTMVGAAEAVQQQREALRFIAEHCRAGQGRGARAGEREAGRQGRGIAGRAGTAAAGKAQLPGRQHQLGDSTRREAHGRKAGGQVGGPGRGGNVSSTRSAGRRGDHERGQGHIGGAGGKAWGKRILHAMTLVPARGVNAIPPLDLCQPGGGRGPGRQREAGQPGAGRALGQGRGRKPGAGMSPAAAAAAGQGSKRRELGSGRRGGNVSPIQAIRG